MNWNCNFSYKHYFEVLDFAKQNYRIGTPSDFLKLKNNQRFILLRHDVDYSLDHALQMAELESDHKINSIYLILLHGPFYNVFTPSSISIIKKISKLGHEIGLHYDTSFFQNTKGNILSDIQNELSILSDIVGKKIQFISQHNVTVSKPLQKKIFSKFYDLNNSKPFNSLEYISDSVQNWRKKCMCNHIPNEANLQILVHPIWWSKKHNSRQNILNTFTKSQIKNIKDSVNFAAAQHKKYLKNLK